MNSFKVYVCENQPVTVEGLLCIFERHPDIQVGGQAPDLGIAIAELASLSADVLLLGQPFNAKSILPLLSHARESDLQTSTVLWVGELSEMDSFRALQMGARGIVRKTQPVSTQMVPFRNSLSGTGVCP